MNIARTIPLALATLTSLAAAGCAAETGAEDGATLEAALGPDRDRERDWLLCITSTPAADDVGRERERACMLAANNTNITPIESRLTRARSPRAGKTKAVFGAVRDAAASFCVPVGEVARGLQRPYTTASCRHHEEQTLGRLVDAFSGFGLARPIEPARAAHVACYGRYDYALAHGTSKLAAVAELDDCILRDARNAGDNLARSVDNSGGADAIAKQRKINAQVDAAIRARAELCTTLAHSKDGPSGDAIALDLRACSIAANEALHALLWDATTIPVVVLGEP